MSEMIERVADAIADAQVGYNMTLIRLVDGVHTYRLRYTDGEELEFDNTDDLYAHVAAKKRQAQARAVIEALRVPTGDMVMAGNEVRSPNKALGINTAHTWQAMIAAALQSPPNSQSGVTSK